MNNVDKLTVSAALIKQALDAGDYYDVNYDPKIQAALGGMGGAFSKTLGGLGSGGYATQDGLGTGIGHGLATAGGVGLGALAGRALLGGGRGVGKAGLWGLRQAGRGGKGVAGGVAGTATKSNLGKELHRGAEGLKGLLGKAKDKMPDKITGALSKSKEVAEEGAEKAKEVVEEAVDSSKTLIDDADKAVDENSLAEALPKGNWGAILGGAAGGAGTSYGMGQGHKAKMEAQALMEDPSIKGMILRKLQEMGV